MIINIEKYEPKAELDSTMGSMISRARTCVVSRLRSSCPEVDDGARPRPEPSRPKSQRRSAFRRVEAVCHDSDERCADSPNDSESLYHCNYPLKELFSAALLRRDYRFCRIPITL